MLYSELKGAVSVKKSLVAVVVFLIVGIAAIIFPLSMRYDFIQYEKDMQSHVMSLDDGPLHGEYNGIKTQVIGGNIGRVVSTLTPSSRKRLYKTPDIDPADRLTVIFPDGARFDAYPSITDSETTYIHYQYQSKDRWLSISRLDTMNWLKKAVSPEGTSNENEVVVE